MARQTINLLNRNIKTKNKPINRITTSNYVNFNQLGKASARYQTVEFTKSKKRGELPMYKLSTFKATNIQDMLSKMNTLKPGQMGKFIAKNLNPDKKYKDDIMEAKSKGKLFSTGADNPVVKNPKAKVTRETEEYGQLTPEMLVKMGDDSLIQQYATKFGKTGKAVRAELEKQSGEAKGKEKKALKELSGAIKEKRGKQIESGLQGVSNVFGSFMDAFRRN